VAFALTRPATWADPDAVIEFVLAMLAHAATAGPEQIEVWVSAIAIEPGTLPVFTPCEGVTAGDREQIIW
jgi:hypothetical protein